MPNKSHLKELSVTRWLYNHRQLRIISFFLVGVINVVHHVLWSKIIIFLQSFNNGEKLCFGTSHTIIHFCYLITKWMIYIWWNYTSYILCFDVLWEPNEWYFVIKTMFLLISDIVFFSFLLMLCNLAMHPATGLELLHSLFFLGNSLLKA